MNHPKQRRYLFFDTTHQTIVTEVDPMRARWIKRIPTAPWETPTQVAAKPGDAPALLTQSRRPRADPAEAGHLMLSLSVQTQQPETPVTQIKAQMNPERALSGKRASRSPMYTTTDRFLQKNDYRDECLGGLAGSTGGKFVSLRDRKKAAAKEARDAQKTAAKTVMDTLTVLFHRLLLFAGLGLAGLAWWAALVGMGIF